MWYKIKNLILTQRKKPAVPHFAEKNVQNWVATGWLYDDNCYLTLSTKNVFYFCTKMILFVVETGRWSLRIEFLLFESRFTMYSIL